ncbi:MAG: hypothetical protein I3I97_01165 [Bifidobacterium thermophilum]|nr:hypothetical protein [Bifidobacterium thermophilum]
MTKGNSFPLPVLGGGSQGNLDVDSIWKLKYGVATTTEDTPLRMRVICDDPDLKQRIDSGDMEIKAHWDCSSTFSSGYLDLTLIQPHQDGATYESSIDQRMIFHDVIVSVFVVACRDIKDFRWSRQHADYGEATFDVRAGDLLSVPLQFTFRPGKLYDPLDPPVGSIFNIVPDNKLRKGIRIDLSGNQIEVFCEKNLFANLQHCGSPKLQLTAVVLPALIDAISYLKENEGPDGDLSPEWCGTLNKLIDAAKLKDKRPLETAQKLLQCPIDGFLAQYTEMNQVSEQ